MSQLSPLSYAYAIGRVRALENFLVPREVFAEAAAADDFVPAMKTVYDVGRFSETFLEVRTAEGLDDFLEVEMKTLLGLMKELLIERDIYEVLLSGEDPQKALGLAENTGSAFIRDFLRHTIDLANIKVFFRVKYLGRPKEKLAGLLRRGGFEGSDIFLEGFDLALPDFGARLPSSFHKNLFEKAARALEERETFVDLERGIEDFLMTYLRRAKYFVFGPEPVFAYGLARVREMALIRLVGMGKLDRIPAGILRERISATYV
jgi:V/A-type H+-transporting ATPase subunit C